MKTRVEQRSNYRAVWTESGRTIRFPLDSTKPVLELEYPEFYDIQITNKCYGNCPYCYQNSRTDEEHYPRIVQRLREFLHGIPQESLPFQIAFGGGEPTGHPEFNALMRMVKEEFNICPNFTTNGLWVSEMTMEQQLSHISTVKQWCGGVAVSTHPHLQRHWEKAILLYREYGIKRLNLHVILSDNASVDTFLRLLDQYADMIDYFVLLPYTPVGRASMRKKTMECWQYFLDRFPIEWNEKIAFGALFYPYLKELRARYHIALSLYEPEVMSKFISMADDGYMKKSSFSREILRDGFLV